MSRRPPARDLWSSLLLDAPSLATFCASAAVDCSCFCILHGGNCCGEYAPTEGDDEQASPYVDALLPDSRLASMDILTVCGICTYHPAAQRWLRTLRTYYDGPCRLYLVNSAEEIRHRLGKKFSCDVVGVQAAPDYWSPQSPGRYCRLWGCLGDACLGEISTPFVLRTDVWDVVFQGDPRDHLEPEPSKILFASESVALKEDSQNNRWLGSWSRLVPDGIVTNGGMICGRTSAVAVLAKVVASNPFGTAYDQSELTLLQNVFTELFEYRPGFMETLYNTFHVRGAIEQGLFVDRLTRKPWCVVHANGSTKPLLDQHCPVIDADKTLD